MWSGSVAQPSVLTGGLHGACLWTGAAVVVYHKPQPRFACDDCRQRRHHPRRNR